MSDQIISAIINGVCVLLGACISAIVSIFININKAKKIKKNRVGKHILPEPFPCSSVNYENICEYFDQKGLSYDFNKFDKSEINTAFVSLVFQFPVATSLTMMSTLSFDVDFNKSSCNQIDLEIKSANDSIKFPCKRTANLEHFNINLYSMDKRILKNTKEICFVIRALYHDGKNKKGTIILSNLQLS